mgnify:FL=1
MISEKLRPVLKRLDALLSPPRCLCCGESLQPATQFGTSAEASPLLCGSCYRALPVIREPICEQCGKPLISEERFCLNCRAITDSALSGIRGLFSYREEAIPLIHGLKERGDHRVAEFLAAEVLRRRLLPAATSLIVPIPSSRRGRRRRGFDQALLFAGALSRLSGVPACSIIVRRGGTEQKSLDREGRLANMTGQLGFRPGVDGKLRRRNLRSPGDAAPASPILLVDDVSTTGATLEAAARLFTSRGVETITGLVIAID